MAAWEAAKLPARCAGIGTFQREPERLVTYFVGSSVTKCGEHPAVLKTAATSRTLIGIGSDTEKIYNPESQVYRGLRPHDFRRTACRNMVKAGIPQTVAMAISGHKTDSMFRRYAIMDKSAVQEAFEVLASK